MMFTSRIRLSIFCLMVFVLSIYIGMQRNHQWSYYLMLSWDSQGYYLYLPAVVLDLGFDHLDLKMGNNDPATFPFRPYPGTDKIFTKYTYGVALMESPFFIASRLIYKAGHDDEPNIYCEAYMISLIVADSFYLAMGMFILGLLLLRYFSLWAVIIAQLVIWLGTNLLFYTSFFVGFSHVYSFFLIAGLLYLTPLIYEKRKTGHIILAAFIFGLVSLIRPTNVVIAFYLLLYDVYTWAQLRARVICLLKNWKQFIWFGIFIILAWIPQFVYWHYLSWHWLLYSYQDEGFSYWYRPKMLQVLFHPQNGFFLFAPLMLLSMVGLVLCLKRNLFSAWAILLIFVSTDYICGSWWCWNFGAAYGFRPYIDFMALLAIPLAFFISRTERWRWPVKAAFNLGIVFLLFVSIRLQIIYTYPWQGPDWKIKNVIRVYREALYLK